MIVVVAVIVIALSPAFFLLFVRVCRVDVGHLLAIGSNVG
jgi:hypothetical protein